MLIINDNRVCNKCGAYESSWNRCSSGHLPDKWINMEEFLAQEAQDEKD